MENTEEKIFSKVSATSPTIRSPVPWPVPDLLSCKGRHFAIWPGNTSAIESSALV